MTKIKKIITHGGQFHADEVLACATLRLINSQLPIERKFKISPIEYEDPTILIIDIGRYYNPKKGLFDHHQDKELHASNLLILDYFYKELGAAYLLNEEDSYKLYVFLNERIFNFVSKVDVGIIKLDDIKNIPTLNSLIRAFNAVEQRDMFEGIVNLTAALLDAQIHTFILSLKGEKRWKKLKKLNKKVMVQEDTNVIPNWKELAKQEGILAMLQPNMREGWQIVSVDTNKLILPEDKSATFRHNSGFLIVFKTKKEAEKYAGKIMDFYGADD